MVLTMGHLRFVRFSHHRYGGLTGMISYLLTLSLMMCVWMLQVAWWSIIATFWILKMFIVWAVATVPAAFVTIREHHQP